MYFSSLFEIVTQYFTRISEFLRPLIGKGDTFGREEVPRTPPAQTALPNTHGQESRHRQADTGTGRQTQADTGRHRQTQADTGRQADIGRQADTGRQADVQNYIGYRLLVGRIRLED